MQEKKNNGIVMLAVLAIIFLAVGFFAASLMQDKSDTINVYPNEFPDKQTLSSSGTVVKYVSPDKAEISFSIETLNDSAQLSQSENAAIADATIKALKDAGVPSEQIKTTGYSVYEDYEWNRFTEKSESIGYRTTNSIQVTLYDTTMAGKVIDIAVQSGVTRVGGVSFGLTEAKELEIRKTALKEASETAKAKAESIASGLGLTISGVSSVNESSFYYYPNYKSYDTMAVGAAEDAVETPIVAGDVQVSASVSVVFEVE